jgi:hypothetical protein
MRKSLATLRRHRSHTLIWFYAMGVRFLVTSRHYSGWVLAFGASCLRRRSTRTRTAPGFDLSLLATCA